MTMVQAILHMKKQLEKANALKTNISKSGKRPASEEKQRARQQALIKINNEIYEISKDEVSEPERKVLEATYAKNVHPVLAYIVDYLRKKGH